MLQSGIAPFHGHSTIAGPDRKEILARRLAKGIILAELLGIDLTAASLSS
jgi:hypothetical protein